MDQETSDQLRALIRKGTLGAGVFQTADCRKLPAFIKALQESQGGYSAEPEPALRPRHAAQGSARYH